MTEAEWALHRYFIWANAMRTRFDAELAKRTGSDGPMTIEEFMYMSLWYAQLFTVIDGWRELKLEDGYIDGLLADEEKIKLLQRYRNGVAHFQKTYFDGRFERFVATSGTARWVRELDEAFGSYFLVKAKSRE